jgi:hypothetical protein
MTQWQLIKTAPKTKDPILVWNGRAMHSAVWDRIDNAWRVLPRTSLTTVPVPGEVTHWMPLPAPPAGSAGG